MKCLSLLVFALVIATLATLGTAYADNGPHGGYSATTDACAGCHRAHTAQGASLLTVAADPNDKSAFCFSCHSGGTGAYTDVRAGVFITPATNINDTLEQTSIPAANTPLKGGGFVNVKMNAGLTGTQILSTTSRHMVTGGSNTVWGYDVLGTSGAGPANVALTCTNCHNPHGKAGLDASGNPTATYRILKGGNTRNTPLFANGVVTKSANYDIPDMVGTKSYGILDPGGNYWKDYHNYGFNETSPALTSWCAQCHTRYQAPFVVGSPLPSSTDSGDAILHYRHVTNKADDLGCLSCHKTIDNMMPPAPSCVVCHVAHGTGARMGTYSGSVAWPDGSTTTSGSARSSLLRLDNRGVCQECHNK